MPTAQPYGVQTPPPALPATPRSSLKGNSASNELDLNDPSTVGSKTVAMFEGFAVGGVWRLGAWEWRLALVGLGKVLLLGYQTSF